MAGRTKAPLRKQGKTAAKSAKKAGLSLEEKRARVETIARVLDREYPDAKCALQHEGPEQLLFATILSAQCTDERVNKVTPGLFSQYPSSKELARAKLPDVERLVGSVNFFRTKAKNLVEAAKILQEKHAGAFPRTIEELTHLPGVGRKTANVVLGEIFNLQHGIVVDTHVKRLVNLIGLAEGEDAVKLELQLMEIVPKQIWTKFSHWLILHGRSICIARRPHCAECAIRTHCEFGRKEVLK
jgi:endonuclease III